MSSMLRRSCLVFTAVLLSLALAGCGGGSSDSAGSSSDAEGSPTSVTPTSSAPTSTPPTSARRSSSADCLTGTWTMKQDTLDLLASAAVPISGITITKGGWTLDLGGDGAATSEARFTAAFAPVPSVNAEADVFWKHSGTWEVVDNDLDLNMSQTEAGVTEVRQAGIAAPGSPLPPVSGIQGGPFECSADRLTVLTTTGSQPLQMVFER